MADSSYNMMTGERYIPYEPAGNPSWDRIKKERAAAAAAAASPAIGANDPRLAAGYGQAQSQMQSFLNGPTPQYQAPGPNRFESGLSSTEGRLSALLNDPSSIQQTAAYKFRVGQGEEALQRQMAAKGMLGSGNRLMELTKYGQDMASQEYEAQAGRLQNLLGTYAGNWNQAQGTNVQEALGRFGTEMQGHTARGNTLANLVGTATQGYTAGRGQDVQMQIAAMKDQPTITTRSGFRTITPGGGTGTFW